MDDELSTRLRETLHVAVQEKRITERAAHLIHFAVDSIGSDAPPRGSRSFSSLKIADSQRLAIDKLPDVLQYVRDSRDVETVGIFDLLEVAPQIFAMFFIFKQPK
jgi:hypothetical protein